MSMAAASIRTLRRNIQLHVEKGDALTYSGDLLILKYAQALHGVDRAATLVLGPSLFLPLEMPRVGDYRLFSSQGKLGVAQVLFIGVPPLRDFGYREIRHLARTALSLAADITRSASRIVLTVHGPNLGLDEVECFETMIAGLLDALRVGSFPSMLEDISIVEREERRADRFNQALNNLIRSRVLPIDDRGVLSLDLEPATRERIRDAGYASESKLFFLWPCHLEMICATTMTTES